MTKRFIFHGKIGRGPNCPGSHKKADAMQIPFSLVHYYLPIFYFFFSLSLNFLKKFGALYKTLCDLMQLVC